MCDPLTIGALALSGGSVIANKIGEDQRQSARDSAVNNDVMRSGAIENQAANQFQKTMVKADKGGTDAQVKAEAEKRTAEDSALIDSAGNYTPPTGSAPQEVGQMIARAGQKALARGKNQARLNADVSAVAGVNQKQGIDIGRDGQWQGIFGSNIRRNAGLLPLELEEANRAGSGARGIGQLLSAGATVAGAAGMAGGGPTWGNLFGKGGGPIVGSSPAALAAPHGATEAPGFFARLWSR